MLSKTSLLAATPLRHTQRQRMLLVIGPLPMDLQGEVWMQQVVVQVKMVSMAGTPQDGVRGWQQVVVRN